MNTPDIVDINDSLERATEWIAVKVNRDNAARLSISHKAIVETITRLHRGNEVSSLRDAQSRTAVAIKL